MQLGSKRKAPAAPRGGAASSSSTESTVDRARRDDDSDDECLLPVSTSEREEELCKQRREPPKRVKSKPTLDMQDGAPLLRDCASAPPEECYSIEEMALSEYQRLHSVCSTEATASSTMQLLSDMVGKQLVRTAQLEKIPKTYDDGYLRAPRNHVGERPCVCGSRCMGRVIAKMRHGQNTNLGFTLTEFLTPDHERAFASGGGLPPRRGKCLLCIRYFTVGLLQTT